MDYKDNSQDTEGTHDRIGGPAHRIADRVLLVQETHRYGEVVDAGQAYRRRQGRRRRRW